MNNKMVYVRAVATLADDDLQTDSVMFPVSALRGFQFSSSTIMIVRYEPPYQYVSGDNGDCDGILVTITSGKHLEFIDAFTKEIAFGDSSVVILGDDVTEEYFSPVDSIAGIAADVTDN